MVSFRERLQYMQRARNQDQICHLRACIAIEEASGQRLRLLNALADVPLSPGSRSSVLDLTLEILSAQYDAAYDKDVKRGWAWELRPLQFRLLGYAVGSSFTRAFTTKLRIPFDGCYSNTGIVGRVQAFLIGFSSYEHRITSGKMERSRGALVPANIKELVFYQDSLCASVDYHFRDNTLHYQLMKRFEEDKEEGNMLTVTPKRIKHYEKICEEAQEAYLHKTLVYDDAKVAMNWVDIIDILRFFPNLETFRWLSDAMVMEPFLGALSKFCPKIRVLELHLSQPFGTNDAKLQVWNRLYRNEETGKLCTSNRILDIPVAQFRCSYLAVPPTERKTPKFPKTCHINVWLYLKTDEDLPVTLCTIAVHSLDLRSLVIDRSKSHPGFGIEDKGQHERIATCLKPPQYALLYVSHLSLISTSTAVCMYIMGLIGPREIQSLELKGSKSVRHIYKQLVRGINKLRKFKITFQSSDEAKERPYNYWKYHVAQMRETLDFIRAGTFALDDLDIDGDFGVPTPHPVESSGLTPDLFFAICAQASSLVRLSVVNTNIDFSFEELAAIVGKADRLTQLAVTCRAFEFEDVAGNKVKQGLGVSSASPIMTLSPRTFPPYPHADEVSRHLKPSRPSSASSRAARNPSPYPYSARTTTRSACASTTATPPVGKSSSPGTFDEFVAVAKESICAGVPLAHLGIYSENGVIRFEIYTADKPTRGDPAGLVRKMGADEMPNFVNFYMAFESCNTAGIANSAVPQPPGFRTREGTLQSTRSASSSAN